MRVRCSGLDWQLAVFVVGLVVGCWQFRVDSCGVGWLLLACWLPLVAGQQAAMNRTTAARSGSPLATLSLLLLRLIICCSFVAWSCSAQSYQTLSLGGRRVNEHRHQQHQHQQQRQRLHVGVEPTGAAAPVRMPAPVRRPLVQQQNRRQQPEEISVASRQYQYASAQPRESRSESAAVARELAADRHHMLTFARADANWDFELTFQELASFLGSGSKVPSLPQGRNWPVQLHEFGQPSESMKLLRAFDKTLKKNLRDLRLQPRHPHTGRTKFTDGTFGIGFNRAKQLTSHQAWIEAPEAEEALGILNGYVEGVSNATNSRLVVPQSHRIAVPALLASPAARREVVEVPILRFVADMYAKTQTPATRQILLHLLRQSPPVDIVDAAHTEVDAAENSLASSIGPTRELGPKRLPLSAEALTTFPSDIELFEAIVRHPQFRFRVWPSLNAIPDQIESNTTGLHAPTNIGFSMLHLIAIDISTGLTKRFLQLFDHGALLEGKRPQHSRQRSRIPLSEVAESLTAHPLFGHEDVWRHEVATPDVARVEFASLSNASPTFTKLVAQWDSINRIDNYLTSVHVDASAQSERGGGNTTLLRQSPRVRLADMRRISEELFISKLELLLAHAKPHSKWGLAPFLMSRRIILRSTNLSTTAAALCSTVFQLPESGHNLLHVLAAQNWSRAVDFIARLANHSCGASDVEQCALLPSGGGNPVHACLREALHQQDFCCNRTPQDLANTSGSPKLFEALVSVLNGAAAVRPASDVQANHRRSHGKLAGTANQGLHAAEPRTDPAPMLFTTANWSAARSPDDHDGMEKCDFVEIVTGLPGPEDLASLMLRNEPLIFRNALSDGEAKSGEYQMSEGDGAASARNINLDDWGIDAFANRHADLLVEVCLNSSLLAVLCCSTTSSQFPCSMVCVCGC